MASNPRIPDRFEVREELYRGDQNVRLRAFDKDLDREVVLEFPGEGVRNLRSSATDRRDVLRQAQMRAKVEHRLVQHQKDFIETDDTVILVLSPCPGKTLEDDTLARGRLNAEQVTALGIDLADAAQALHAEGIVHRAIAAPNILVEGPGQLSALTGFAFAKNMVGFGSSLQYRPSDVAKPAARALPAHPAPEQVAGQPASARSDVFSLGCVLYECLTGRPAIADHTTEWVDPADPKHLVPDVPKKLAAILMKCLEHGPTSRYNTMLQLKEELESVREALAATPTEHHSAVAWISGAVAMVALVLVVYVVWGPVNGSGGGGKNGGGGITSDGPLLSLYTGSHAVLVGINSYKDSVFCDLKNAEEDVKAISEALIALGWNRDNIALLTGPDATKERIDEALRELEKHKVSHNDQVFIYFSGHGDVHQLSTDEGFFIPYDGEKPKDGAGSAKHWMSFAELRRRPDRSRAKHVLMALDCCRAGNVFSKFRSPGRQPEFKQPEQDPAIRKFLTKRVRVLMASCGKDQLASDGVGPHSAYAQAFLDKLKEAKKSTVTHWGLVDHASRSMAKKPNLYAQYPDVATSGKGQFVFYNLNK